MLDIGLDHLPTDRAWAAGIFSGEGSTIAPRAGYGVIVTVGNTNLAMLERMHSILGCGRIYSRKMHSGMTKPAWIWKVGRRDESIHCLDLMWEWLTEEKREQARKALAANPVRRVGPFPGVPRGNRTARPCKHCGQTFTPEMTPAQRYCSIACRNVARYHREYYGDIERQREIRKLQMRVKRARIRVDDTHS